MIDCLAIQALQAPWPPWAPWPRPVLARPDKAGAGETGAKWVRRSHEASAIGLLSAKVMGMYQPQLGEARGLPGGDLVPRLPMADCWNDVADTGLWEK